MTNSQIILPIIVLGYMLLPMFIAVVFLRWGIRKKGERPPVEFVLKRGPGESLRRKINSADEDFLPQMMLIGVVPLVIAGAVLAAAVKLGNGFALFALVITGVLVLAGVGASMWWATRYFRSRRNNLLGYLGERGVAEELEPLQRDGYRIFHDIPVEKLEHSFNLDHVVVGPTGIYAIETKTRRKGRAREGFEEHKVFYDGRQLIWPWAEDTFGLKQAQNEADWLTKWVKQMTGLEITAKPVLALPGWWVETRALGPVSVQNPKNLPTYIRGKGNRVLSDEQIELIARQLDVRCRDVKD